MIKKIVLAVLSLFLLSWAGRGQNIVVVQQTCSECGVTVKGRLLQASDHKPGCKWAVHSHASDESESTWGSEPYSESGAFENVEGQPLTNDEYYELLIRTRCDYCGGTSIKHNGDCIVGRTYKWWQDAMHSGQEWKARTMRDNIVTLILGTESGKAKLHAMRGIYTPEPERPTVNAAAPLLDCPKAHRAPQFSGINEQSVVYDKLQTMAGIEYDIERKTHTDGGPVILGKRNPDGTVRWHVLHKDQQGNYVASSISPATTAPSGDGELRLTDVHFEGEGQYVVQEYEGGYKKYYSLVGHNIIAYGYQVGVAPMMINGRFYLLQKPDPSSRIQKEILYSGPHGTIFGDELVLNDDAIIERNDYGTRLLNWNWKALKIGDTKYFKDVQCYKSDRGPYYVIEVSDGQFALVAYGFRQVGGIYGSSDEAHAAWRNQ